jgi:oligopeptide/dipeptide ABC transporter ATP-binding protein
VGKLKIENLLEIRNLSVSFTNGGLPIKAVRNVNLSIKKGEVLGLVGESGAGKSVTAMSIAGLIQNSNKTVVNGQILINGKDLTRNKGEERFKSQNIAMIFQDPIESLNPTISVGAQVSEVFMVQKRMSRRQAWARSVEMLRRVQVPSAEVVARQYPHQLSGGMCQRIMIAIALSKEHELLIADEPTTALDVTIQAQILQLLYQLYQTTQTSILFITHDLGIIAQFCHSVAIMYAGEIVEKGTVLEIFTNPLHPYTKGLLNSIPVMGKKQRLQPIDQNLCAEDSLYGCNFFPRCLYKTGRCREVKNNLIERESGHFTSCHRSGRLQTHD